MRKSITTFLSAAAVSATLIAGAAASPAQAAGCSKWQLPSNPRIVQDNNHTVNMTWVRDGGYYKAKQYNRRDLRTVSTEVEFRSVTPRLVKFIITWINDTAGVYTGTIDSDGFVSGTTRDRFNSPSKASWYMSMRARCVG
jgi:hypothetical protein